ncbi:spike glycoprotein [Night heron coronavirus HKU19]|uniref:Spike glycoprotein n=1 Tax=Night heron coronavirus HKU19 TaxID=1159904 RepID=H9BR17_9NIDO|nr:S gene product [Night heron coronavirus HKU19]AFD29226.1 spike glycoprotein [Night heron coronavirus HKU19]
MQCVVLVLTLISIVTSRPNSFADRVFDALTFPHASNYLHVGDKTPSRPQLLQARNQGNYSAICPENGYITSTSYDLSKIYYLTDGDYPIDGVYKSLQPLKVTCVPEWHGNSNFNDTTGWKHYFDGRIKQNPNTIWCPCSQSGPGGAQHNAAGNSTEYIRFHSNITTSVSNLLRLYAVDNQYYYFGCTPTPTPLTFNLTSENITLFTAEEQVHYCYANINGTVSYIGVLPPKITELTVGRYGDIFVNGFLYFKIPNVIEYVQLSHTIPHNKQFYTVFYANMTQVLLNISMASINRLLYCDKDSYSSIACAVNQFEPANGFYSTSAIEKISRKFTFVTMPTVQNHSYYSINLTIGGCGHGEYPHLSNKTGCYRTDASNINAKQITFVINTYTHDNWIQWAHKPGNCPWALNKINNYNTAGTLQVVPENQATCCTDNQASWLYLASWTSVNVKVCFNYQPGTTISIQPQQTGVATDISVIYENECVDYNIYGKTGTGIIQSTNVTLLAGRTYTSASGQLLAFKYLSNQTIYSVTPCDFSNQVAVYNKSVIAAILPQNKTIFGLTNIQETPNFYIANNAHQQQRFAMYMEPLNSQQPDCTPVLTYAQIGICADGQFVQVQPEKSQPMSTTPIVAVNITIPKTFNISVQTEYIQISTDNIVIDCQRYVCNGNPRCLMLLSQYQSACSTIEQALHQKARLESLELSTMLAYSPNTLQLANVSNFQSNNMGFNLTNLLPQNNSPQKRSVIEDLLFSKVVTNGLGTVDVDYKKCTKGLSIADLPCAQYYNGIMVLPGVADSGLLAAYTASLTGGMVFGGLTSAAAIPFATAVQARLNYVALQTDVLQRNQQILANAFNQAMGNITLAFKDVKEAIATTADAIRVVAGALDKIQQVVNSQGQALSKLTGELQRNFQAISASIEDIYNRLNDIEADAQVDRLITGRLAALNAFLTQTLTQANEVKAARELALQKINECVKDQSKRYGFCGNGYHLFSIANAAPKGFIFFHTVLQPETTIEIQAIAGFCVSDRQTYNYYSSNMEGQAYIARDTTQTIFLHENGTYMITPRKQYQPRTLAQADVVKISTCDVTYVNLTSIEFEQLIPEYVDINSTVEGILNSTLPGKIPDLNIGHYNNTILNLTTEINDLQSKAENLSMIAYQLEEYIKNINNTLVDLEWLNRVETYLKWPWYVWLAIALAFTGFVTILITIFLCTGCCGGCFGCCGGCFGLFSKKIDPMRQYMNRYETPTSKSDDAIPIIYKKNW